MGGILTNHAGGSMLLSMLVAMQTAALHVGSVIQESKVGTCCTWV